MEFRILDRHNDVGKLRAQKLIRWGKLGILCLSLADTFMHWGVLSLIIRSGKLWWIHGIFLFRSESGIKNKWARILTQVWSLGHQKYGQLNLQQAENWVLVIGYILVSNWLQRFQLIKSSTSSRCIIPQNFRQHGCAWVENEAGIRIIGCLTASGYAAKSSRRDKAWRVDSGW